MKEKLLFVLISVCILLFTSQIAFSGDNCDSWAKKDKPLSYWFQDSADGSISRVSCENTNCIKISRSTRGRTFITKKFEAQFDGDYGFKTRIKATNIITGDKRYERGKFQVRLFDSWGKNLSAKRNYYPNADFNDIPNWQPLVFTVENVKKGEVMEIRIGLQEAKGTVLLSDFEFCFLGK